MKVADRTAAEMLINTRLYVDRAQLPEPEVEEFYLADLIGLGAFDRDGTQLGTISAVHDYGAGASLEIEREDDQPLLVPFTRVCVPLVDVVGGRVVIELPFFADDVGEAAENSVAPSRVSLRSAPRIKSGAGSLPRSGRGEARWAGVLPC